MPMRLLVPYPSKRSKGIKFGFCLKPFDTVWIAHLVTQQFPLRRLRSLAFGTPLSRGRELWERYAPTIPARRISVMFAPPFLRESLVLA